ncbi:MAG: hypothetical protein IKO10_16405 [Lachnospiraceae bacterium]|nr:hypothetical protein [Lachnospiraceae bacterium]
MTDLITISYMSEIKCLSEARMELEYQCDRQDYRIGILRPSPSAKEEEDAQALFTEVQNNLMSLRDAFRSADYLCGDLRIPVKIDDTELNFVFKLQDEPLSYVLVGGVAPDAKVSCSFSQAYGRNSTICFGEHGSRWSLETARFISNHWTEIKEKILIELKRQIEEDIETLTGLVNAKTEYIDEMTKAMEDKDL